MELEFLLISKINGIDRIFYDTDRPALTKINVINGNFLFFDFNSVIAIRYGSTYPKREIK